MQNLRSQPNTRIQFLKRLTLIVLFLIALGEMPVTLGQTVPDVNSMLDSYNVTWDLAGPTSAQSMPIGNGDIGLNVWAETNGDICFYIGKTDAWSEDNHGSWGLLKLGMVRISVSPKPIVTPFLQVLKLRTGEIQITQNTSTYKIWVDANNPVIRVEQQSASPDSMTVSLTNWRKTAANGISADVFLSKTNQVAWYHRNSASADPHVANRVFGAIMKGDGLISKDTKNTDIYSANNETSRFNLPFNDSFGNGYTMVRPTNPQNSTN